MNAPRRRRARPEPGSKSKAPVDARGRRRKGTGHTGGRNGGKPPTNLWAIVGREEVHDRDGKVVGWHDLTMIDRACRTIEQGGMAKDAAARLGVRIETYRTWLATGVQVGRRLAAGQAEDEDLTDHERQCVELEFRTWEAEYTARADKLAKLDQVMNGIERVKVIERRAVDPNKPGDQGVLLERTEHRERAMPDANVIRWWLQMRWPDEFREQVTVAGPDGGPVVDLQRPVDALRDVLNRFAESAKHAASLPLPDQVRNGNGHHEQETTR